MLLDLDAKANAAVEQMRKPHVAQAVIVLVERETVEPQRDATAAAYHLG